MLGRRVLPRLDLPTSNIMLQCDVNGMKFEMNCKLGRQTIKWLGSVCLDMFCKKNGPDYCVASITNQRGDLVMPNELVGHIFKHHDTVRVILQPIQATKTVWQAFADTPVEKWIDVEFMLDLDDRHSMTDFSPRDIADSDAVPFVTGTFLSWFERGIPMVFDASPHSIPDFKQKSVNKSNSSFRVVTPLSRPQLDEPTNLQPANRRWKLQLRLPPAAQIFFVFGINDREIISARHPVVSHSNLESFESGGREITNFLEVPKVGLQSNLLRDTTSSEHVFAHNKQSISDPFLGLFHHFQPGKRLSSDQVDRIFEQDVVSIDFGAAINVESSVEELLDVLRDHYEFIALLYQYYTLKVSGAAAYCMSIPAFESFMLDFQLLNNRVSLQTIFAALEATIDRAVLVNRTHSMHQIFVAQQAVDDSLKPKVKPAPTQQNSDQTAEQGETQSTQPSVQPSDTAKPLSIPKPTDSSASHLALKAPPAKPPADFLSAPGIFSGEYIYSTETSPFWQSWKLFSRSEFIASLVFVALIRLPLEDPVYAVKQLIQYLQQNPIDFHPQIIRDLSHGHDSLRLLELYLPRLRTLFCTYLQHDPTAAKPYSAESSLSWPMVSQMLLDLKIINSITKSQAIFAFGACKRLENEGLKKCSALLWDEFVELWIRLAVCSANTTGSVVSQLQEFLLSIEWPTVFESSQRIRAAQFPPPAPAETKKSSKSNVAVTPVQPEPNYTRAICYIFYVLSLVVIQSRFLCCLHRLAKDR